jgi:HK97 family phage prohead protease
MRIVSKPHRKSTLRSLLLRMSASSVFDHPWCLSLPQLEQLAETYRAQEEDDEDTEECDPDDPNCPPFPILRGVAAIPVHGVLLKSRACFSFSFATSYSAITRMVESAMRRADVTGVLLSCRSGGGDSCDMLETSEFIRSCRAVKPIVAVSDDAAYSAAYCVASAAEKVFCTRTGGVGSIGVWSLHSDVSGALQQAGIRVSVIQSGKFKTDCSPYGQLSDHARTQLQSECDRLRLLFAQCVSVSRSCSVSALLSTEADIFPSQSACPLLADGVIDNIGEAMDYLEARTKRTYLSAGSPDYPEGCRAALPAPSPRRLTSGRPMQNDPALLTIEDSVGGVSTFIDLDLERLRTRQRSGALTKSAENKLRTLETLRSFKQRYPQAIAVQRVYRRSASASTGRRIDLLAAPYGKDCFAQLGSIREVYRAFCFKNGMTQLDVRCLYDHGSGDGIVLGRVSADTLRVWEQADGLHATCDVANTTDGDNVLENLRVGNLTDSSAAFFILSASYEDRPDGYRYRIIESAVLRDVSVVPFPAYSGTSATLGAQALKPRSAVENELRLIKCELQTAPAWKQGELRRRQLELLRKQVS